MLSPVESEIVLDTCRSKIAGCLSKPRAIQCWMFGRMGFQAYEIFRHVRVQILNPFVGSYSLYLSFHFGNTNNIFSDVVRVYRLKIVQSCKCHRGVELF